MEHISEQHQQLSSTFAAQSAELARVEREVQETRDKLALRETELVNLRQKKERRASVSKVHIYTHIQHNKPIACHKIICRTYGQ